MAQKSKARKEGKNLKKSKKMEDIKPLAAKGVHYSSGTLYVRKSGGDPR